MTERPETPGRGATPERPAAGPVAERAASERATRERPAPDVPEPDRGPLPPWFPVALVALGVIALAATVRTTGGLDHGVGDGPLSNVRILVVLPMVIVLGWLAVAYGRRRDPGFGVLSRAGAATVALIATVTVVVALGLVLVGRAPPQPVLVDPEEQPTPSVSISTLRATPNPTPAVHSGDNSAALPLGLIIGAFAVVVAVFAFLALVRAVRRPRLPGGLSVAPFNPLDEAEELAEAVEAGSQALEERGDAREAVIACYVAMEQAVAGFGFARPLADTPEDMLRRATQKSLVPAAPATRLTELFREARFSRHVIIEAQRNEARTALAEIAAYIRELQEAAAAEAPAGAAAGAAVGAAVGAAAGPSAGSASRPGPATPPGPGTPPAPSAQTTRTARERSDG